MATRKILIRPYTVPRGGQVFERAFRKTRLPKRWAKGNKGGLGGRFRISSRGTWGKATRKKRKK